VEAMMLCSKRGRSKECEEYGPCEVSSEAMVIGFWAKAPGLIYYSLTPALKLWLMKSVS